MLIMILLFRDHKEIYACFKEALQARDSGDEWSAIYEVFLSPTC